MSKMQLAGAQRIINQVRTLLEGSCDRIEVVGSIRRQRWYVGDAELLCIPKTSAGVDLLDREVRSLMNLKILDYRRNKLGRKTYGAKNKLLVHVDSGFGIDIFSTTEECWWVSLVVRTGGKDTNMTIAMAAINKGYQFHAYGAGFSTPAGEIVCKSERDVFEAVGLPYREPWERV